MDDDQQYCLRWNNHQSTLISVFDTLLENETLVDCTLAAEGKILKAHKVVLSACSPYFATLLQEQYDKHPVFILKDVKYQELRAMMDYMYRGEVNISQDQLAALLKAAESLQIKGLSDNRTGASAAAPKPEPHHRSKMGAGYTLEQTKRARMTSGAMDSQDVMGSREGSSSPSRRRRKVRRRSVENDVHDNSNSSVLQAVASNQTILQQSNTASALVATQMPIATTSSTHSTVGSVASVVANQGSTQQQQSLTTTTNVTKKTESAKGTSTSSSTVTAAGVQQSAVVGGQTSDAINTESVQIGSGSHGAVIVGAEEQEKGSEKSNHKQKLSIAGGKETSTSVVGSDLAIEPKAEYDDEGQEENVEDLTLDDEEMGMEELDQTAGTSQGGEGSSQGYAAWPHDRSQEELLLATQEAQQRDPQGKQDKSEQTDITAEEYELDDCLLESNDIVITQNKDGFVLHVKKLGNITTAKLAATDEDHAAAVAVAAVTGHQTATITELHQVPVDVKPSLTPLTTTQTIKLPSSECELINLKKIIPSSTTISTHQPHTTATIIQPHQIHHHIQQIATQPQSHHQSIQHSQPQHQHQQLQEVPHTQVQNIVTAHPGQTINLMGLRNVQITEQKPIVSRIKYSRGKIITPTSGSVQIVETHETVPQSHHELTEGTKYEISEIDLNNPNTSAAIISDLVKYAEIDDIELPDGTKIGIGFAPTEISEHIQTATGGAQITAIAHESQVTTLHHHQHEDQPQIHHQLQQIHQEQQPHIQTHHIQHHQQTNELEQQQQQQQHHHHQHQEEQQSQHLQQLQEHEYGTTTPETILPDEITVHEQSKSYTILTTRPMKSETSDAGAETTTTTYELSLSDSSMGAVDDAEARYVCRHCGKKYRWKSTLRRHENVECGGKEPCHPCPYCTYKAKQRGNLGVHVRKHHPDKPQLESKRGRKM